MAMQLNGHFALGMDSKLKFGLGMLNLGNLPYGEDALNPAITVKKGRDYSLMVASAQWKSMLGALPWSVGLDYVSNSGDVKKDYYNDTLDDEGEVAVSKKDKYNELKDETTAMAFSFKLGQLKNRGDWKLRATYAQVGANAIPPRFAQNEWTAMGSGSPLFQNANYSGFGLEAFYACSKDSHVAFRTYQITTAKKGADEVERDSSVMMFDYSLSI